MPRPDAPPLTRAVVLRGIGFGLAIALGAVAVWLIVTGSMSPRRIEIGVLAGLWGLLLGAYTMFGARRAQGDIMHYVSSAELEVRSSGGLEPAAQAEARRAFEERLEHLLRSEISSSISREVGDLRHEVAQLRQELLDKVGGQLRLERIETTRLFGSDLEALQDEVRQLKTASDSSGNRAVLDASAIPVAAERVDTARDAEAAARAIEAQAAAERRRADVARTEQAARERAAYENASRERAQRERAQREQAQREQAQRDKAQRDKAQREQAQREQAQREQAQREQAQRDKAAAEQAARRRVEAEQAARQKAAAERTAREKAAAERAAREKAAAERAAREKAAAERAAREKAAAERAAREKAAAERAAQAKAAAEQAAREKAAAERAAQAKAAAEQAAARDKAAAEQAAREAAATEAAARRQQVEQAARDQAAADRARASKDPFASLPRITPFTDFELDPVETADAADGSQVDEPSYTGRRRAGGADIEDAGRHSRHAASVADSGGRRRRDDDDDENGIDLLSQLLSRGSADR